MPEKHAEEAGADEAAKEATAETTREKAALLGKGGGAAENIVIWRGHRSLDRRGAPWRDGGGRRGAKGASATAAKGKAAANPGEGIAGKAQRQRRGKSQNQSFVAKRHGFILAVEQGQLVAAPDIWE
jgi:hypothetical protein